MKQFIKSIIEVKGGHKDQRKDGRAVTKAATKLVQLQKGHLLRLIIAITTLQVLYVKQNEVKPLNPTSNVQNQFYIRYNTISYDIN